MADPTMLSPMEAALQRLTSSRLQLRSALIPQPRQPGAGGDIGGTLRRKLHQTWQQWRTQWLNSPAIDVVLDGAQRWWNNNPWREVVQTLAGEVSGVMAPAVRRRPWTAVLIAAGTGYAIAAARPWRWSLVAAQLQPWRQRAVNWVVSQAVSVPLHTMLASLMALMAVSRGGASAAAATGSAGPAGAGAVPPQETGSAL